MKIRFGYCPPSPGPNNRLLKYVKWFTNIDDAIKAYDGHTSIWINASGIYREITFDNLLKLANNDNQGENRQASRK